MLFRSTVTGASGLSSASATAPALETNDDATLEIALLSLQSAVPAGPPPGIAILLQGTSSGTVSITDSFIVGGAPGTAANVQNGTGGATTVNLPP